MKTVRFSEVVSKSGRPEPYTLWLAPDKDPDFQKALKAGRIMSVHQETVGSKADYGEIGYTGTKGEILLFPKSLKSFAGKRVIGVKYDLLASPPAPLKPKPKPQKPDPKSARKEAPKAAPPPEEKRPEPVIVPKEEAPKNVEKPRKAATPKPSGNKIVQFEPKKPAKAPDLKTLHASLVRAMKALKAGKDVHAYELLQELEAQMRD